MLSPDFGELSLLSRFVLLVAFLIACLAWARQVRDLSRMTPRYFGFLQVGTFSPLILRLIESHFRIDFEPWWKAMTWLLAAFSRNSSCERWVCVVNNTSFMVLVAAALLFEWCQMIISSANSWK